MTYLVSDIHGNMTAFRRMIDTLYNPETDKLMILGDVIDRGSNGLEILEWIIPYVENQKMDLLMGNHELFMLMFLQGELTEKQWIAFGGEMTVGRLKTKSEEQKERLKIFLENLPYQQEFSSAFLGECIATHSGIDLDNLIYNDDDTINVKKSIEQAASKNRYGYMIGMDLHFAPVSVKKKFDRYIICGHVPSSRLNLDMSNRIHKNEYFMNIDCGAGYEGGVLGCYCLETNMEYYFP